MGNADEITRLLRASRDDAAAHDRLYALVYDELRAVARNQLRAERDGHTLQPTALAHEVYLKLLGQTRAEWENRGQFFAVAARAMRRILVDHARTRLRQKRGGDAEHVDLDDAVDVPASMPDAELVALDDALSRLEAVDAEKARIVQMRSFVGLQNDEIAEVLGVSTRTVERHWRYAKAWLYRAMRDDEPRTGPT